MKGAAEAEALVQAQTLLLVEDDHDQAAIARHCLARIGCQAEIVTASDGEMALWHLTACPDRFALVLLDLRLPLLDGIEVLQELNRQGRAREQPIVVLSSSDDQEELSRALGLGAVAYRVKQIGLKPLRQLLLEELQKWAPHLLV